MTFRLAEGPISAIPTRPSSLGRWRQGGPWDWALIAFRIHAIVLTVVASALALTVVSVALHL